MYKRCQNCGVRAIIVEEGAKLNSEVDCTVCGARYKVTYSSGRIILKGIQHR